MFDRQAFCYNEDVLALFVNPHVDTNLGAKKVLTKLFAELELHIKTMYVVNTNELKAHTHLLVDLKGTPP